MRGELPEVRLPDQKGFLGGISPEAKDMKPQGSGRQFRVDGGRNLNQPGDAERTIAPLGQRFEGNRNPGDNGPRPGESWGNPLTGGYPDGPRNPLFSAGPFGRFFMRSEQPKAYWIGVHLPRFDMSFPPRHSSSLVIRSESLSGILFFDATPWLIFGGLAMLVSVLFWLPMVRNLTRSISRITMATEQIADGKFDTGVDERRNDELGRLGAAINRMAARLSGFMSGQRRFLGDTAHELCSPIARMQMALGILEERVDDKNKPYVEDVREEVQQMSGLVNELLSFSKASFSREHVKLHPVKVAEVMAQAMKRDARPENDIKVSAPPELAVQANADLLQRALGNLLRNAIRYAGEAGPIQIEAKAEGAEVVITVADEGPGVPEGSLAKLFDPFYRVDESRTRETGGIGLGLTIVKTCVEACGGTVSCRNRQPHGLEVAIRLSTG
jgi:two-component system sensor histidine kinase CpxA